MTRRVGFVWGRGGLIGRDALFGKGVTRRDALFGRWEGVLFIRGVGSVMDVEGDLEGGDWDHTCWS